MSKYFSPSTLAFYDDRIFGARQIAAAQTAREIKAGKRPKMIDNPDCKLPSDAIPISDDEHRALMDHVAQGKTLGVKSGRPIAVDQERSTEELLAARRRLRDRLLADSDWTQLPDTLVDDQSLKANWADYRQQLRDLDMAGSDWPEAPDNALGGSI
mgnify:CR=1 FL=1